MDIILWFLLLKFYLLTETSIYRIYCLYLPNTSVNPTAIIGEIESKYIEKDKKLGVLSVGKQSNVSTCHWIIAKTVILN